MGVYGCLTAFDTESTRIPRRANVRAMRGEHRGALPKIAEIRERLHVKMGRSVQACEKADRWMMGRRKRVIKLKNVMEKSSGVVDLASPSPSPSVLMMRPKGSATYISAAFNPLGYVHRIPSKIALTHFFVIHIGRTSSSVLDLISDYEHWTYVCDSCFFWRWLSGMWMGMVRV